MIFLYKYLTTFLYPVLILFIYLRKFFKKEHKTRFKEKVFTSSFLPERDDNKKLIWFHAASIGETQSIFPIIQKINLDNKNIEFLITTVTLSAGNIVEKKIKSIPNLKHRYFPMDVDFLVKSFLTKWKPNIVTFVDSEIWPNLIFEIKKRNIPLILMNGRITRKTFKKWMIVSSFAQKLFGCFDLCLASSKESKENLEKLKVSQLKYIGNIKFSSIIKKEELKDKNLELLNNKKLWCASSTHKGEEVICIKAHLKLKEIYKNLLTIIVPRHIERSKEIFNLCLKFKISAQVLNDKEFINPDKDIIIVNSFGTLLKFYNYSNSIFMGKSLIKDLEYDSGQNPIEAAKLGCKIYHGPYVYNFQEVYDLLKINNISEQITNEIELVKNLNNDFKNFKSEKDEIAKNIEILGREILNNTAKEFNKFI